MDKHERHLQRYTEQLRKYLKRNKKKLDKINQLFHGDHARLTRHWQRFLFVMQHVGLTQELVNSLGELPADKYEIAARLQNKYPPQPEDDFWDDFTVMNPRHQQTAIAARSMSNKIVQVIYDKLLDNGDWD